MIDRKLANNLDQCIYARRATLSDGKQNGLEIIECDNGSIHFVLDVSHALDIYQLSHEGTNISFISKNGLTSENGSFAQRFPGGMLYTCGFDSIGNQDGHIQHGRLHTIPAKIIYIEVGDRISIVAEVEDTALFGNHLVLRRTITTEYLSGTLSIEDCVTNQGFNDAKYVMLYHFNIGYPMLDNGTKLLINREQTVGATQYAEDNKNKCLTMEYPNENEEQVFYHQMNEGKAVCINGKAKKMFTLEYDLSKFDYLVEWKSNVASDYSLGLEPTFSKMGAGLKYRVLPAQSSVIQKFAITIENL